MQKKSRLVNWLPYLIVLVAVFSLFSLNSGGSAQTLSYEQLQKILEKEKVSEVSVSIGSNITTVKGTYTEDGKDVVFQGTVPSTNDEIEAVIRDLDDAKVTVVDAEASNVFLDTLLSLVPFLLMAGLAVWMINRMNGAQSANGKAFEFSKSRAKLEGKVKVRFDDVAGCDEEKQEMAEIIQYLKYPKKFEKMGARIPKGILLAGHPLNIVKHIHERF